MADLQPDADRVLAWHDGRVGAYEWDGPGEAALWHLDRLSAARPRDGLLRARCAGVLHRLGRDDEARKALQEARDLGGMAPISDWCRARAASYDRGGRPADALWWREWLAGQVPDDPVAWAELAHSLAKAGRFAEAADRFDRAVALAPDRLDFRRGSALARLGAGDRDGYRAGVRGPADPGAGVVRSRRGRPRRRDLHPDPRRGRRLALGPGASPARPTATRATAGWSWPPSTGRGGPARPSTASRSPRRTPPSSPGAG